MPASAVLRREPPGLENLGPLPLRMLQDEPRGQWQLDVHPARGLPGLFQRESPAGSSRAASAASPFGFSLPSGLWSPSQLVATKSGLTGESELGGITIS